jgi:DnaJ-class molecular chaperone
MTDSMPPLVALVAAGSVLLLAALVAAAVVGYLAACRIWPYANCGRCSGSGKSGSPTRKTFRKCPRCKGTGRRTRIGRRLLDRHTARNR